MLNPHCATQAPPPPFWRILALAFSSLQTHQALSPQAFAHLCSLPGFSSSKIFTSERPSTATLGQAGTPTVFPISPYLSCILLTYSSLLTLPSLSPLPGSKLPKGAPKGPSLSHSAPRPSPLHTAGSQYTFRKLLNLS